MSLTSDTMKTSLPVITFVLLSLTGCAAILPSKVPNTVLDDFGSSEVYSRAFPGTAKTTCEAGRRALLGQGYIIEDQVSSIKAQKNFQPGPETHIQVRFTVTCADNSKGSNSATVFVNAVKDRYSLRKSTNSASVGIPAVSFSVPLTSTDEALVKVASETIASKKFYNHFFDTLERFVEVVEDVTVPGKGVIVAPVARKPESPSLLEPLKPTALEEEIIKDDSVSAADSTSAENEVDVKK